MGKFIVYNHITHKIVPFVLAGGKLFAKRVCRHFICPAVLTENLFQDNKEDVDFLLSEEGKQLITKVHVDGILSYIKSVKK